MVFCDRSQRAFTLIELLIVVAIIAILAAIAAPNFLEAQIRAKLSRCRADMHAIDIALELYRVDEETYPLGGKNLFRLTTPIAYIATLPNDPFGPILETDRGYNGVLNMYGSPVKSTYIYHGPEVFRGNAFARISNIHWVLTGLGPDKGWFDNSGGVAVGGSYPMYDPSNGTKSRGSIEVAGPGNISGNRFRELWDNL